MVDILAAVETQYLSFLPNKTKHYIVQYLKALLMPHKSHNALLKMILIPMGIWTF